MKNQLAILVLSLFALITTNNALCQTPNHNTVMELLKRNEGPKEITNSLGWELKSKAYASLVAMGEGAVEDLILIANDKDQKTRIRLSAISVLADMHCNRAVPTITRLLDSQSETVRWNAIECLGKIGTEEAIVALLAQAGGDDSLNAYYARRALLTVINPDATDELIRVLDGDDAELVYVAQHALGNIPTKKAFEAILGTFSDNRPGVRRTAASVLGTAPIPEAIDYLKKSVEAGEKNEYVRLELAMSLIKLGDKEAIKQLHELAATGTDIAVRRDAIQALVTFADTSVIPLLEKLLSENSEIRWSAVYALGELGDDKVVPALEKIAEHDRLEGIRKAASVSIEKIRARAENK